MFSFIGNRQIVIIIKQHEHHEHWMSNKRWLRKIAFSVMQTQLLSTKNNTMEKKGKEKTKPVQD